ncbi:MAG TPA: NADH-quinone oxidoreductase subunit J [Verrucomicrobiales bacterium]|nr:NADH-quinone oxidoreductase subunit J [Verrucomicrobiales bacterium]HIL71045.1 NADH-quinone oxidoreductase subunit J [Verrucomicrobiota bacterium]
MQDLLFYFFAVLTLIFGFLVVVNPFTRSPVTSAMFLVLSIISMSGLFVMLHAFFLAAIQILVYSGAVIVLFLFVIMLMDLKEEARSTFQGIRLTFSLLLAGLFATVLIGVVLTSGLGAEPVVLTLEGSTAVLGERLFNAYIIPFEILSVLLLVGMVGVVLLSKKNLN